MTNSFDLVDAIAGDTWPNGWNGTCHVCGKPFHYTKEQCAEYLATGWPECDHIREGDKMADKIPVMSDDDREIYRIIGPHAMYQVGWEGITKIKFYQEPGQQNWVNCAAVYKEDFLFARVDLAGWTVEYKETEAPL